ncbi:thioredoxin-3, putative [Entamoeba invadens IP1]|uniref:Thioredoxin-3, putative n=1 Tax=Entamoeba invadens IP1 TaxID=370355 RepID=A0A0A1U1D0_ENTIV|nr:thioredoxin-3, putative [Entamoeba invadens IP1]ELP84713.1 thioredoxin-3, putative [Entamoeba invadens IP1]|eukprot:XP_004184059.1 thioredoxin-3, putative [Entamoeba invadens IP1]
MSLPSVEYVLKSKPYVEVVTLTAFKKILSENQSVAVDFFATWCGPCKMMSPIFIEMAKKYPHVKCVKVDVDQGQEVAQEYRVTAMPTFKFFKRGVLVAEFCGANPQKLEEEFKKL